MESIAKQAVDRYSQDGVVSLSFGLLLLALLYFLWQQNKQSAIERAAFLAAAEKKDGEHLEQTKQFVAATVESTAVVKRATETIENLAVEVRGVKGWPGAPQRPRRPHRRGDEAMSAFSIGYVLLVALMLLAEWRVGDREPRAWLLMIGARLGIVVWSTLLHVSALVPIALAFVLMDWRNYGKWRKERDAALKVAAFIERDIEENP